MLNERELSKAELEKREEFIKDLKGNKRGFVKRYGKDAEKVMYAIATKRAKKQNEEMNKDKIREMIKSSLQGPVSEKKGKDMDGDGDIDSQDYLAARDAAIKKAKGVKENQGFGSSDISAMLNSMHRALGNPTEFPGLTKIMDAAGDAVDFYLDDVNDYFSDRDDLVMDAARQYARRQFPEFMTQAAKFIEPIDEMDRNDPIAMRLRADKMKKSDFGKEYGDAVKIAYGNDKNAKKLAFLKKERAQLMRDMEQEAELEGGPIADRYGDMLNKIDKAIAMLQGQSKGDEYMSKDEIERRAAMIKEMSGDKMEALMELRNILDELQVLGDQARNIIANSFPSYLSKGEAYGAFDMGSSVNRYDTTLASIVDEIEEYGDEEEDEDMMQEDLDLGHQDNEPHMLKADLYRIGKYAMELYQILDQFEAGSEEVDLPHWWQSKIIKSKDAIVGAKHYLDFEIKEPQIDAMVDVADQEDVIDEAKGGQIMPGDYVKTQHGHIYKRVDGKVGKSDAYVRVIKGKAGKRKTGLHDSVKLTLVNKDGLEKSVNEGVWSLGSAKSIKNIIGILDMALDIKDPQELMDLMDMHDKSMYNIVGDDVFHDDIDGAKRELAQNNLDRAYNRLIDAKGRAKDLLKIASENDLKNPSIFEEAPGEADMVASDIQKAMNKHKKDDAKMYQLQKARTAMNKGDLDKAKKIAARLAEKLKSN